MFGKLIAVTVASAIAWAGFVHPSEATSRDRLYVVQPGDTLWAIADRMHLRGDLALYVDALITLNGGSAIVPGQQLRLP